MSFIEIDKQRYPALQFATPNSTLLVIRAGEGLLACGYMSIQTANRLGECLAVVRGVSTLEELLDKEIAACSDAAIQRGIKPGQKGRDALKKMSSV